jgi:N-methylhydantoinase A
MTLPSSHMEPPRTPWRIGVDVGGTFTDLVLIGAEGRLVTHKTPSNPADPAEALFRGLEEIAARLQLDSRAVCSRVAHFIHGTTIATNTLLERRGAKTGLLVTQGFRDSLEIRRGYRENMWDHRTPWAPVLVPRLLRRVARERMSAQGDVLTPLCKEDVEAAAAIFRQEKVETVGICFLHAYCNPTHEIEAQSILQEQLPGVFVCTSHEVAPIVGEFERSSTVAVNAYIADKVVPYLGRVRDRLRALGLATEPYFVQSSGGVISFEQLRKRPAVLALSGPAAGSNSLRAYLNDLGESGVVSIEVGGTSCDVTVMEKAAVAERASFRIGDDVIALPAVDIHTIAVGGGTIAGVDDAGLLFVGPKGAGARPGPAAFGLGGEAPTITDAQVLLGRLRSGLYAGGAVKLDVALAENAIRRAIGEPLGIGNSEAAVAVVRLAEQKIRHAVERVTLERGQDPALITLLAGGGAGPLHAVSVARALGIRRVFVPRLAGVFCAFGMCNAHARHDWMQEIGSELNAVSPDRIRRAFEDLATRARRRFASDGFSAEAIQCVPSLDMRYVGQSTVLSIESSADTLEESTLRASFEARHQREFGFIQPGGSIEVATARLVATAELGRTDLALHAPQGSRPQAVETRNVWLSPQAGFRPIAVFDGGTLPAGSVITGPALIEDSAATTLAGVDDVTRVDAAGNLHIHIAGAAA